MFWNFLNLQRMLDSLFDDGWCNLGLHEDFVVMEAALVDQA